MKYHTELTPARRIKLLRKAQRVSKFDIKKDHMQTRLKLQPSSREMQVLPSPKSKSSTRALGFFDSSHPELHNLKQHLMGVAGKKKSENAASAIVKDISKALYYYNDQELDWAGITDRLNLLQYMNRLEALNIGPEGQLSKLEGVSAALQFLKLTKNFSTEMKSTIQDTELYIQQWKRTLRSQKSTLQIQRIERASEMNFNLQQVTKVVEHPEMWGRYHKTIRKLKRNKEVSETELKFSLAAIMVTTMLKSCQRPGAVVNCTVAEYENATTTSNGTTVVKVFNHKTGQQGTAKLTFDSQSYQRLKAYYKYIRPRLAQPGRDIDLLFILPGSAKVLKFSNMVAVLKRTLKIEIPSATLARKIGATCAAKSLDYQTNQLVTRQMSHQPEVSARYYEAVHGIEDSAKAFECMESLRSKEKHSQSCSGEPSTSGTSPTKPTSSRWSTYDTSLVERKFHKYIRSGKTPELQQCCNLRIDKTPKQIQDKVRTIVRQNLREQADD